MSSNRHVILNHVDSPLKYVLWTKGEILLYLIPIFIGLFCDQLTLGIISSGINIFFNREYKKRFGKGQFQAVKYWFFPAGRAFMSLPPSHIREYLG